MLVGTGRHVDVCRERLQETSMVRVYLVYNCRVVYRVGIIDNICRAVAGTCFGTAAAFVLPGDTFMDRSDIHLAFPVIVPEAETRTIQTCLNYY